MSTVNTVTSRDGTTISFERYGAGPALVAVDGAMGNRDFRPQRPPVELLAADFTVYLYDRRGRGASADTQPFAVEREIDDLAAVITEAGGSAFVYGMSSGGLLALHAAASGLPIRKLALLEPPIEPREAVTGESEFTAEVARLVAADRRREAVAFNLREIGVPDAVVDQITPESWAAQEAVVHTLVYDCRFSDATTLPLLRSVTTPTLVIDSAGSSGDLTDMAATIVKALPNSTHRSLPGEWHGVSGAVLAPVLREFFQH